MRQSTHLNISNFHHWPHRSIPIRSALPEDLPTQPASVATDLAGKRAIQKNASLACPRYLTTRSSYE